MKTLTSLSTILVLFCISCHNNNDDVHKNDSAKTIDTITESIEANATDTASDSNPGIATDEVPSYCQGEIRFPDRRLNWEIRSLLYEKLGKENFKEVIDYKMLQSIDGLAINAFFADCTQTDDDTYVWSLKGMECMHALKTIMLPHQCFSDVSPLATLQNLEHLSLYGNLKIDPSPFTSLKSLKFLALTGTQLTSSTFLAELTSLEELGLGSTTIDDISSVADLKNLKILDLADNNLTDFPLLTDCAQLEGLVVAFNKMSNIQNLAKNLVNCPKLELVASGNQILDLTALVENPRSGNFSVWINENPIDCTAQADNIATLINRGDKIYCDCPGQCLK
jgi:hypothetical protein